MSRPSVDLGCTAGVAATESARSLGALGLDGVAEFLHTEALGLGRGRFEVVETGVDPVTPRFSGVCSAN